MAYEKTTWVDRVVQFASRFRDQNNNQITLTPDPGEVTQQGTPLSAANLNKIERTLFLTNNVFITSGTDNAYIISVEGVTSNADVLDIPIKIKIHESSDGASTLNFGDAPVPAKKPNGNAMTNFKSGGIYTVVFDGAAFILQGEGGEYGNATAADVLAPKTIGTDDGIVVGTMPERGAITITPSNVDQTIPNGHHNGAGKVKAVVVPADKVLADTTIAGTTGTIPLRTSGSYAAGGSAVSGNTLYLGIPADAYYRQAANITISDADFKPENIIGTLFGMVGTAIRGGQPLASGAETSDTATVSFPNTSGTFTSGLKALEVTGLSLPKAPTLIIARRKDVFYSMMTVYMVDLISDTVTVYAVLKQGTSSGAFLGQVNGNECRVDTAGFRLPVYQGGVLYDWAIF
ncbi:hypothetical protein COLU111180_12015 [Cohnella lubricantis]|uniref:Tail fiber protein n=1 Tax=Cohnella lubricantis TaxID=2163172 RepID=A0A841T313_9BACL|nr:hypothetical protein [Cohnella lubricantis]MBB6675973.1 hypothetical protein [Cohnella lubricantis]MBP2117908.1 hypothetical protein [Cohnella lubricantis]